MSGVYFPGMEMPKSCFHCPMRQKVSPDDIRCLATGEIFEETFTATIEMRNGGKCKAVFVPDHGPLIDADELIAEHNGIFDNCCFSSDIRAAPVLIPADGEDAGG